MAEKKTAGPMPKSAVYKELAARAGLEASQVRHILEQGMQR